MERYLGYKIIFKLNNKNVRGILHKWDDINEQVEVFEDDRITLLDINDINDLDIIEEDDINDNIEENIEESINVSINDNNFEENINDNINVSIEENINNNINDNLNEENINENINDNDNINQNINNNINNIVDDNIECQEIESKINQNDNFFSYISSHEYENLLNDCFSIYGPSKEEFFTCVSIHVSKILKEKYSRPFSLKISLGSNNIYNCIGYIIGRMLSVKGNKVYIEEGLINNIDILKYKYLYMNSTENKYIDKVDIHINLGEGFCDSEYTVYFNKSGDSSSICIMMGCLVDDCHIKGEGYLIDVNISEYLYKKYRIKRLFNTSNIIKLNR